VTGSAYHVGVAHLLATKDRKSSVELAESTYRDRIKDEFMLPEELALAEHQIKLAKAMVNAQADLYQHDDWELLQPEVQFCVPLPGTEHHCDFVHDLLYPGEARKIRPYGCNDNRCVIPHYLKGTADGLNSWKGKMWIIERKTSALTQEIFWTQWQLASQPTGYIYGCWKATGIRPNGFILEKVQKPRKNAADPFHVSIEREPFLRSDDDLREFERDISQIATDYERAGVEDAWYKNTASCTSWNRKCDFHDLCKRNQSQIPGEFRQRDKDYVELEYYKLLGLPIPEVKGEGMEPDAADEASA
jgi:hypothetical protein